MSRKDWIDEREQAGLDRKQLLRLIAAAPRSCLREARELAEFLASPAMQPAK